MNSVIVCHCVVVRDHEIRTEVRLGADTVEAVGARCGAGTVCGGCREAVAETIIDEVTRGRSLADDGVAATARH
ncbi:MAG: (2Fe-2S)-binding protein [Acidimicrobiales bacterium]|nr:(2Fe-2S)-binding protein [Acidimicrobiales bacterium]